MNLTNYHSHSTFCDGHASLEQFVEAALAANFSSYGFSSHAPLPYHTRWNMDATNMQAYLAEANRLKQKYAGQIELYVGLEIDYLTIDYNPAIDYFQNLPLDYRIGSIHTVADENAILYEIDCKPQQFKNIVDNAFWGNVRRVTELYLDRLQSMIVGGGFDIVGHADKMHALSDMIEPGLSTEKWYLNRIDEILQLIATKNVIVEINTKKYLETGLFFPDVSLWDALLSLGIRVMVNSDAHYTEKINNGRVEALQKLKEVGFKSVVEIHNSKMVDVPIYVQVKNSHL